MLSTPAKDERTECLIGVGHPLMVEHGALYPSSAVCLSISTFAAEIITLLLTGLYTSIQLSSESDGIGNGVSCLPDSSVYCAGNGFCLPSLDTHLTCWRFDVLVCVCYCGIGLGRIRENNQRLRATFSPTGSCFVSLGLAAHVWGHFILYTHTKHTSIREANLYEHWSFTWVLLVINAGYCLPRICLYPPRDIAARAQPRDAFTSFGIFGLMILALIERTHCAELLHYVGGHILYDIGIALLAIGRELLSA